VYYGIRVNGRLVAAAGTHVIGRRAKIAVVGNVLTQPEFRGRGYAQATTGAVTARLLEFCDHVVLNVRSDNPPALNAYRRLGYAEHVRFEERLGHRIGSLWADVASALRRFARSRESQPR
jgi:predicted GNAT family acetyltransferase